MSRRSDTVLFALRTNSPEPPGATPDQLLLLVGDPANPSSFWIGTRDELAAEQATSFLINEPVGILINIGHIRRELTERLGKTS